MESETLGLLLLTIFLATGGAMKSASMSTARAGGGVFLPKALWLQGVVTKGYGRGSKKLGVPTANLPHFDEQLARARFQRGVYYGWGRIRGDLSVLPCVANIGVSPTFAGQENPVNIVEAHFLDCKYAGGDFYDEQIRLSLVGFLRPEQKFKSLDDLIGQINKDIVATRQACAPPLIGLAGSAKAKADEFLNREAWGPVPMIGNVAIEQVGASGLWGVAPIS